MKNTFFTAILFITFSGLMAQNSQTDSIPKNYIGINLSGNYSNLYIKSNTWTHLNVATTPFYGRRIKRFVFGTGISFDYTFDKAPSSFSSNQSKYFETEKNIALLLVPTIRYYSKFNLFITASFIAGKGKGEHTIPIVSQNTYSLGLYDQIIAFENSLIGGEIGIGYAIKAGKSFLIEPKISFQKILIDAEYKYTLNPLSIYNIPGYTYGNNLPNSYYIYETRDVSNFIFGIGVIYRY